LIIIGIDPGSLVTGYGIIQVEGGVLLLLDYGVIRPPAGWVHEKRLYAIFEGLDLLLEQFTPAVLSVETQYVHKNIQSAIKLGMVRGTVMVCAARRGLPVFHYAPTKAKQAVVGTGRATKAQVQYMVRHLLQLKEVPQPEDAADALALAICHANTLRMGARCLSLSAGR